MKRKKKLLVSDLLDLMNEDQKVTCIMYAYGCFYGNTARDGMETVKECKENMLFDCLNALVFRITTDASTEGLIIHAEIVH